MDLSIHDSLTMLVLGGLFFILIVCTKISGIRVFEGNEKYLFLIGLIACIYGAYLYTGTPMSTSTAIGTPIETDTATVNNTTVDNTPVTETGPAVQSPNVQSSDLKIGKFQQLPYNSCAWRNQKFSFVQVGNKYYTPLKSDLKNKIAEFLNDGNIHNLTIGEKLDLGQGYALEAKDFDDDGKKVWLEFTKDREAVDVQIVSTVYSGDHTWTCEDGEVVDDQIVSTVYSGDYTWTCEVDKIQGEDNVPVLKVHVNQILQSEVGSVVQIDGIWLIDYANVSLVKQGHKLNGYEIVEITNNYISYR